MPDDTPKVYRPTCPGRSLPDSCGPARCLPRGIGRSEKSADGCCRAGRTHLRFFIVDLAMYISFLFRFMPE